ncbi:T9SS type A sorting domain-containing protein [Cytophagaceae bacterium YF14B1]|uniref:T9SS type A sorting domain-containing protein n=1 Tax=Xanthocytophaga flava TaxID=3048013 RepID=A0AAE3QVT0_9BACT|nr:T9SS type A sorting domain-containing protein [Xanthocytophaga flavus]MDJ1486417.1 T9SS type A sorting domain-containing protein [Xanthocytophaga flavus]
MNHLYKLLLVFSYFLTQVSYASDPIIISPEDRSTVNIATQLIIKTQANDLLATQVKVKILLNDPRTFVYETIQNIASTNQFVISDAPLQAGNQYLIEVSSLESHGYVIGQTYYTIFTEYVPIVEAKPFLINSADTLVLYETSRYFGINVNPNNPNARKVTVKFYVGSPYTTDTKTLTADEAIQPINFTYIYDASQLEKGLVHFKELTITTFDSLGTILAQNTYNIPYIVPVPKVAEFISPVTGATDVSTTPTITLGNYSTNSNGGCTQWIFMSYEIDRYPADWKGEDYIHENVGQNVNQWTPSVNLQPNTKYEIRVRGGFVCYGPTAITSTFTTGGSSSSTRFAGAAISDELDSQSIVSPNPFSDQVSIQLNPTYQNANITLVSMQGRVLFSKKASANETISFTDNSLAPGLYLINITDQTGKKEQFKIIKQ